MKQPTNEKEATEFLRDTIQQFLQNNSKLKNKYCNRVWSYYLKKNPTKEDEEAYINNVKVLLSIIKIEKWSQENK